MLDSVTRGRSQHARPRPAPAHHLLLHGFAVLCGKLLLTPSAWGCYDPDFDRDFLLPLSRIDGFGQAGRVELRPPSHGEWTRDHRGMTTMSYWR